MMAAKVHIVPPGSLKSLCGEPRAQVCFITGTDGFHCDPDGAGHELSCKHCLSIARSGPEVGEVVRPPASELARLREDLARAEAVLYQIRDMGCLYKNTATGCGGCKAEAYFENLRKEPVTSAARTDEEGPAS